MNVSFKGIQNIGAFRVNNWIDPTIHRDKLVLQLNNDGQNNDLDDFQEILDAFPNKQKSDSLELEFNSAENGNYEISLNSKPFYKFSKFSDEWRMKTENLETKKWDMIKQITGLLERIAKKDEPMPLEKEYLQSEDSFENFKEIYLQRPETGYQSFVAKDDEKFNRFVNSAHSPEETSEMAKTAFIDLKNNIKEQATNPKDFIKGIKSHGGFTLANNYHKNSRLILELSDEKLEMFGDSLNDYTNPKSPNSIIIDRSLWKDNKEVDFAINGEKIEFVEENFQIYAALQKLTTEIDQSDKELELPEYYLTDKSFDELSTGFKPGMAKAMYKTDDAVKQREGLEFKLAESSDDAKDIARLMSKTIDRKMKAYLDS